MSDRRGRPGPAPFLVIASLLLPLVAGLTATVLIRLRLESLDGGNTDPSDRIALLGTAVLLPVTCYALTAVIAFGVNYARPLTAGGLLACAAAGSLLAVVPWVFLVGDWTSSAGAGARSSTFASSRGALGTAPPRPTSGCF